MEILVPSCCVNVLFTAAELKKRSLEAGKEEFTSQTGSFKDRGDLTGREER